VILEIILLSGHIKTPYNDDNDMCYAAFLFLVFKSENIFISYMQYSYIQKTSLASLDFTQNFIHHETWQK